LLYVSTRDKTASYTAYRTLHEERAPDGGVYVPFRWQKFTDAQLHALSDYTFGENVARILNTFFGSSLTDRDVALCIGKNTVQSKRIGHRLTVYEMWHNPKGDYRQLECALYHRMYTQDRKAAPTGWARIAIRIALLFGIFGQLMAEGIASANLVVTAADTAGLCAAWYARKLGLPMETIVYCCTEESGMWDFFSHGTLNTRLCHDAGMERLVHFALGSGELERYLSALVSGGTYALDEQQLAAINDGIFPAVVGKKRILDMIHSVYRMNGYVLDTDAAVAFGGQQDHRAHTGETGYTVMLSLGSPTLDAQTVHTALGIEATELSKLLDDFKE